jgi:dihydroneopterin aldolase
MIQTIQLVDIILHGYHGLFEEEKLVGNTFKINVTVVYTPSTFPITNLPDTIDYGAVFQILKGHMQLATPLLETLAANFCLSVFEKFSTAQEISIHIQKMMPPIAGMVGSVAVGLTMNKNDIKS